jgi:hypothetical protein
MKSYGGGLQGRDNLDRYGSVRDLGGDDSRGRYDAVCG